ncbi:MAG: GTP pyrophosphokinase family protein [Firmicutes bacterium]|nr:GTP pyrophosphokinase family protein [Bacillota bacterium]MDD4263911.1 GTP pyrophosphokinase family protein [Bacillota bacterium]MDD4694015.1 GTP pyrophosphokinase family protein [Bacillota bacterium]
MFQGFLEVQQVYNAAIKEVSTKLEILNDEFQVRYNHNPIRHIESRLKTAKSIYQKLKRRGFEINTQSAKKNLTDIAGIRVVCCYIDDIYTVADLLLKQKDVVLVTKKDYIKNPKENGYRSLHLVIKIPIYLSDRTELIPVEIQIRTVAMDFWASLEHQLRYKKDNNISQTINAELYECAESIAALDLKMQSIFKQI